MGIGMGKMGYKRYEILINPSASSGKGMKVWKEVKRELDARGVPYRKHLLKAPGEATLLVRALTKDLTEDCHLLVLGGDGTQNEVLNGIQDFKHTILSCLRTGSGNDFAANVGVKKNAVKALDDLLERPMEARLDYGLIRADEQEPRRFLISCGMGYDADICEEVSRSKLKKCMNKIGLGKLVYLMIGIKQIFTMICDYIQSKPCILAKLHIFHKAFAIFFSNIFFKSCIDITIKNPIGDSIG